MDIVFFEAYKEEEEGLREALPENIKAQFTSETIQASLFKDLPSKLISVRTQSIIPGSWSDDLKGVLSRSAGYDHLEKYLNQIKKPIACGYIPDYASKSVAEHAVLNLIMLFKKQKKQMRQWESFNRDSITGSEISGKKLLVLGVGSIGQEVVQLARNLGMEVCGVDLVKKMNDLEYVTLEEGVLVSDAIIVCLPKTSLTENLVNFNLLSKVSKKLCLVNISRGEITPINDIERLLDENILDGVSLDVFEDEGILSDNLRSSKKDEYSQKMLNLLKRDNVIFTPHNAFNTKEALNRKIEKSIDSVVYFLKKGTFPNQVEFNLK